jgi:hypothetical protein
MIIFNFFKLDHSRKHTSNKHIIINIIINMNNTFNSATCI